MRGRRSPRASAASAASVAAAPRFFVPPPTHRAPVGGSPNRPLARQARSRSRRPRARCAVGAARAASSRSPLHFPRSRALLARPALRSPHSPVLRHPKSGAATAASAAAAPPFFFGVGDPRPVAIGGDPAHPAESPGGDPRPRPARKPCGRFFSRDRGRPWPRRSRPITQPAAASSSDDAAALHLFFRPLRAVPPHLRGLSHYAPPLSPQKKKRTNRCGFAALFSGRIRAAFSAPSMARDAPVLHKATQRHRSAAIPRRPGRSTLQDLLGKRQKIIHFSCG